MTWGSWRSGKSDKRLKLEREKKRAASYDSRKSKEIYLGFRPWWRREEWDRNGWLSGIRKTFRPSFHYPDPIILYPDWLSVSRFLRFFRLIHKIIFPFVETRRWVRWSKIQTSLATKITRDACKNCTRQCSFFFFLFQRSEHFNRKIYSIGWNGPLPQRKKAFSSFSSFYNRHHRDRKWPISARVELVKLCLTYTPAIS